MKIEIEKGGFLWGDANLYAGMFAHLVSHVDSYSYLSTYRECAMAVARNPDKIKNPDWQKELNASSRDMFLGSLLIIHKLPQFDKDAFCKKIIKQKGDLCEASDDGRHKIRLSGWILLSRLKPKLGGWNNVKFKFLQMLGFAVKPLILIQALTCWRGYELNLCIAAMLLERYVAPNNLFESLLIKILRLRYNSPCWLLEYLAGNENGMKTAEGQFDSYTPKTSWNWPPGQFEQWLVHRIMCKEYWDLVYYLKGGNRE